MNDNLKTNFDPREIKGLFVHEQNDPPKGGGIPWKEVFAEESKDCLICFSWTQLPVHDKVVHGNNKEILGALHKICDDGQTFDMYFVMSINGFELAYFKATIVDFATEFEYEKKYSKWMSENPTPKRICPKFSDYEGDKIVFLASFEPLDGDKRIPLKNFIKYKDMTYNKRGNIVTYTRILTDDEIKNKNMIDQFINLLERNSNLVLTGAPGTGKTYLAKQIASKMILGKEYDPKKMEEGDCEERKIFDEHCDFVQFHPSYDYTDFVEGLRPTKPDDNGNIGFKRQDGVFKSFCKAALMNFRANGNNKEKADKFVFVIDEINRGDISKIFGELFFSIDPGYRGKDGRVQTQYQNMIDKDGDDEFKDGFYVPENVYIIGTMNDIDRSVESMDFAMRRRFAWKEIKAEDQVSMLSQLGDKQGEAVRRMTNLNNEISRTESLTSAYHIGPSYFLKLLLYKGDLDGGWKSLWNNHIEGVLREYLRGADDVEGKIHKLHDAYDKKD